MMSNQILTAGLQALTALGVAALLLSLSLLLRWHERRAELEARIERLKLDNAQLILGASTV